MAASSKMDEIFQNCAKVSGLNSLKDFQRDCIENLSCGNDVVVCCKTGSGKSASSLQLKVYCLLKNGVIYVNFGYLSSICHVNSY